MKNDYPHIFSPLTVKNMTIKNRIVMMPMGTNYGEQNGDCLLYTSPSPRDMRRSRMPSSA